MYTEIIVQLYLTNLFFTFAYYCSVGPVGGIVSASIDKPTTLLGSKKDKMQTIINL